MPHRFEDRVRTIAALTSVVVTSVGAAANIFRGIQQNLKVMPHTTDGAGARSVAPFTGALADAPSFALSGARKSRPGAHGRTRRHKRPAIRAPFQIYFRHLYSEGNQNVTRMQHLGLTRMQAHAANTLRQYYESRVHLGRAAALLSECANGSADFTADTHSAPPFLFGAQNVDIAVPPEQFAGLHRMYEAMDQLADRMGHAEWQRTVLRPWCVSRLVRTWETAFMAAQRASDLFPVDHRMDWIVCRDLDEALPTDRSKAWSVHRSIVRKLGRVPPENQPTSLQDNVQRLQCFSHRTRKSLPCPLRLWYASGPLDNEALESITTSASVPSRALSSSEPTMLALLGTFDEHGWTPSPDARGVDWTAHTPTACDFPELWNLLFFTHSKCIEHMFDAKVANGECICRTDRRYVRLPV